MIYDYQYCMGVCGRLICCSVIGDVACEPHWHPGSQGGQGLNVPVLVHGDSTSITPAHDIAPAVLCQGGRLGGLCAGSGPASTTTARILYFLFKR